MTSTLRTLLDRVEKGEGAAKRTSWRPWERVPSGGWGDAGLDLEPQDPASAALLRAKIAQEERT